MTLSTSRQQFLAYETQNPEDIHYGRRGGIFISSCVCVAFVLFTVVLAALVGVIVYFITFFKISQDKTAAEAWDENVPFGIASHPSPDLRLPSHVVPSYYRLKLYADLDNSNFTGEVYITIRASKHVKEIILHSKDLNIDSDAKLTEQIYERLETLHSRRRRQAGENDTLSTETNSSSISEVSEINNTVATTEHITAEHNDITTTGIETSTPSTTVETTARPATVKEVITPVDTQVTHSSVRNIKIVSITGAAGDRLILKLATPLAIDVDYTLQLSFSGNISNTMTGFYQSTYTNSQHEEKKLGVTQFEPTSARAAFPCFDEPAFKARFELSAATHSAYSVLANMPAAAQEPVPEKPGWIWTHFERSVSMSTYLVAFVFSDFKSLETTYVSKDNVTKTIKVWTRPELINKAHYALNITPKLLSYYEDVFGVPYALNKIDLIAIPDFSSGAMENWGLITFRETTLLYDESEGVPREKQSVCIDVAHELAHQWFGNLVTMRWWTDLWLNEGFATYIEYLGVDYIEPEWKMFDIFIRDKMDLLRSDALKNTSPVSRRVIDASEISQKFDEISYNKGANLIRMLNHTISEDLFHKGLVIYLKEWKYANAEENDLWKAMSKATATDPELQSLSVVDFMNSWTRQAGYPVLMVSRDYEKGTARLEQRLFSSSQDPYKEMLDQIWHIPVSHATVGDVTDYTAKPKYWLKKRSDVISVPANASEALYVNVDAIGYYRVNYDKKNWELLSSALKSGLVMSPITKAQLIDDAFNLAKGDQLDYSYALGLTTCVLNGEDSKIVWEMLLNNMGFLKHNLKATPGYVYFQDFMKILLKGQLERLNYGLDPPRDDNEALFIESLLMWECYMEAPRCLDWAQGQFRAWMERGDISDNPIPSYLRSVVYNVALKYGSRREFDFLWRVFVSSSDPGVKSLAINNLPSTRDEPLITMLLEKSLTEIPKQYAVAAWSVEAPGGAAAAQRYLEDNFERVHAKFAAMDAFMLPAALSGAYGFISDEYQLQKLKSLALRHREQLRPLSQSVQKLLDTAALRIRWVKAHAAHISDWLRDYVHNTTSANSTSKTPGDTVTASEEPTTPKSTVSTSSDATTIPSAATITPSATNPTTPPTPTLSTTTTEVNSNAANIENTTDSQPNITNQD